jgi:hypothetical protein
MKGLISYKNQCYNTDIVFSFHFHNKDLNPLHGILIDLAAVTTETY